MGVKSSAWQRLDRSTAACAHLAKLLCSSPRTLGQHLTSLSETASLLAFSRSVLRISSIPSAYSRNAWTPCACSILATCPFEEYLPYFFNTIILWTLCLVQKDFGCYSVLLYHTHGVSFAVFARVSVTFVGTGYPDTFHVYYVTNRFIDTLQYTCLVLWCSVAS